MQPGADEPPPDRVLAEIDAATATLEAQRGLLGDDVVTTALEPLRERRAAVVARMTGERRKLVTVLFADLVGFTALSRRLDAEDTREVVGSLFTRWQQVIEAHGGVVEKFIGDAVMAVFGLHRATEDDPHRAIRAGRALVSATADLADDVEARFGVRPHVRVGVDTGDVVVSTLGERSGHDFVAVGPTVNRASRLQGEAPVDGVIVSEDTQRLVRGRFGLEPRPALRLKGIEEPVNAYVVIAERPRQFVLDRDGDTGTTVATVGRQVELRYLQERLDDVVEDGRWSVVTVVGDAGVGKSRLLLDLDAWLAERPEPTWWFRGRAWPSGHNRAGALLRDVLASRFGIADSDPVDVVRDRVLAGFVAAHGPGEPAGRAALVVGTWLGFDTGPDAARLLREPQALRDEGTRLLAAYFAELAATAPVVVLLEDLHWADDVSVRWLDAADEQLSGARVLVVCTTRPSLMQARPHWAEGLSYHRRLHLEPLSRRESRTLLRRLLDRADDPPGDLVDLVVGAAEGNPFYISELVTWLVDSGVVRRGPSESDGAADPGVAARVRALTVPSSLRGVLQARIDTLTTGERGVVERAAVVGRVFWDQAVEHLASRGPTSAGSSPSAPQLEALRRRDIVVERERSAFGTAREFLFTHALLRDVAYDSVLRSRRAGYHRLVASWLAEAAERSGRVDEYASVVAEHLDAAADPDAGAWYLRAGRQAAAVFALPEATRLLGRALEVLPAAAETTRFDVLAAREEVWDRRGSRDDQRADLDAMAAVAGLDDDPPRTVRLVLAQARWCFQHSEYGEAEVLASRAAAVARDAGLPGAAAQALLVGGKALTWRSLGDQARERLAECLQLARAVGARDTEGEALRYLAMVASNEGDYPTALRLGQQALDLFADDGGDLTGEAESVVLVQHATTLYHVGRYAQARAALERVLPVFRRTGHRYAESVALGNLASIGHAQGRLAEARRRARQALEIVQQLSDREASAVNTIVLAQIETATGALDVAAELVDRALQIARAVPSVELESDALSCRSWIALEGGDPALAAAVAEDAVRAATASGSSPHVGQAELARGYARLSLGGADLLAARSAFATAAEAYTAMGLAVPQREARAGEAAVALAAGDPAGALRLVEPLLDHLDVDGLAGSHRPGAVLTTCRDVLAAAGDPRVDEVAEAAAAYLADRAAAIGDDVLAARYLARRVHADLLRP